MIEQIKTWIFPPRTEEAPRFGTFDGVFLPTLLTILGAVMYLRTGWVVGNAGLGGALLIIGLANLITICTGLSISSVATNIRVGAGGAFSIIAQSLGLEVAGSINLPFYAAQSISAAFYIFAFSEGWQRIFPGHPVWLITFIAFGACFAIAFFSVNLAARIRYPILFIVSFSLFSVFLGLFDSFGGITQSPQLWGGFPAGSFWEVFAVFFPAVTGVLTGVSMSGILKNPRRSLPVGTMAAIGVSFAVYLGLAYWASLVATPDELVQNLTIMVDRAAYGPAILVGILAATFSAALNSLVGAPRVLQAMAKHGVLPRGEFLGGETAAGEPRPAMYVTGGIGLLTLIFGLAGGGLNAIAPLMTMFFLMTYAVLNGVVLLEQTLGLISFRPLFKIPRWVPLIGLAGSLAAMFLINPIFSIVAITFILVLYGTLSRRQLTNPWGDVRSGIFVTVAEWAAKRVISTPFSQERAWRPSLLVPVRTTQNLRLSYRFIQALTYPHGSVHVLGLYEPGQKKALAPLESFAQAFHNDGIFARVALVEMRDYAHALQSGLEILRSAFFRPNTLFLSIANRTNQAELNGILDQATENRIGAVLYADNPETGLGREQLINVWIRDQSPEWAVGLRLSNLDLLLLLAYEIAQNWQGQITLIMIIRDAAERENGERFLDDLVNLGRMPRDTRRIVAVGSLDEYLPNAPQADLNIFGLGETADLAAMERLVRATDASCIFVCDSGEESALA